MRLLWGLGLHGDGEFDCVPGGCVVVFEESPAVQGLQAQLGRGGIVSGRRIRRWAGSGRVRAAISASGSREGRNAVGVVRSRRCVGRESAVVAR